MRDSRIEGGTRGTLASGIDVSVRAGMALLPLACWPNLEHAFSTPKLALLLAIDLLLALLYLVASKGRAAEPGGGAKSSGLARPEPQPLAPSPRPPFRHDGLGTWQALTWVAAVSVSVLMGSHAGMESLALALAAAPLSWAVAGGLLAATPLATAVAAGAAVESAVALLQFAGADPLQLLGWRPEAFSNPRMRVYGTLGNPDFVAAWCCAALPFSYFAWVERARSKRGKAIGWGAVILQLAAILATGSRAALLVLAAQAVVLLIFWGGGWRKWLGMLPVAALVLFLPGSRALNETIQGRLYLARVSMSQARQIPVTGYGPGAFETRFAQWQVEWLRRHGAGDASFAGPVDHAHNDYIEFLVEYGPLGLCALLAAALPWAAVRRPALRPASGVAIAAAAGFAGLLAAGCVDFPLHRPAEWALFWLYAGVMVSGSKSERPSQVGKG